MQISILEPHLGICGGIRRVLELSNRLVERGHDVVLLVPPGTPLVCKWMPVKARLGHLDRTAYEAEYDVVLFNDSSQYFEIQQFENVHVTVYYHLDYGVSYNKPMALESYLYPVNLRLANSRWTAANIEKETGQRPVVLPTGVNPDHFRPVNVRKRYDALCYGSGRVMKGTDLLEEACSIAGVKLEKYDGKGIPQHKMAHELCAARMFLSGSWSEGFNFPGLEALACGIPLVITEDGGSREYATHEETALVVPPQDPEAMARAIRRILDEPGLGDRLAGNGLDLVKSRFNWHHATVELERVLLEKLEERKRVSATRDTEIEHDLTRRFTAPFILPKNNDAAAALTSIVILSWDQLAFTRNCIESIRAHTTEAHEIIVVDNGSQPEVVEWVKANADKTVINGRNLGFARGMNQGLNVADGDVVVFLNNDTVMPEGWLAPLHECLLARQDVGLVSPVVTASGSFIHRRQKVGDRVREVFPFSFPPAGVCFSMRAEVAREVGGWPEAFAVASGEDTDLCFSLWSRGYRLLVDERVLIHHESKATASAQLDNWRDLWKKNRALFLKRWCIEPPVDPVKQLPGAVWRGMDQCLDKMEEALGGRDLKTMQEALEEARACFSRAEQEVGTERRRFAITCGLLWKQLEKRKTVQQKLPYYLWKNYLEKRIGGTWMESTLRWVSRRPKRHPHRTPPVVGNARAKK